MAEFTNPFVQNIPQRKMTNAEIVRAIRINVAAELEATSLYEAHAEAIDDPFVKKVLLDIANEERVHVGEFMQVLKILLDDEEELLENGADEVREMAAAVARGGFDVSLSEDMTCENESSVYNPPTIGSLK